MLPPLLRRLTVVALLLAISLGVQTTALMPAFRAPSAAAGDGCYTIPKGSNSPTGIAGCVRFGRGIASYYAPGGGVAMNFCTWTRRHSSGCGRVSITALSTGRHVTVPVVDFCDCYTGTSDERIVDLQTGVLAALGLNPSRGLYQVVVERPGQAAAPKPIAQPSPSATPVPSPSASQGAQFLSHRLLDPTMGEDEPLGLWGGQIWPTGSWQPSWYHDAVRYLCWQVATDAVDPIC